VALVGEAQLAALNVAYEIIDGRNMLLIPGLIDGHQHLIGAGGEQGFTSRMPEIPLEKIICAGITTVVGLLGTDTTTRHLECLHAKTSQLCDEGITAYMYTGGFELPPRTLFSLLSDDVVMIDKIIGTGEIAISDERYVDPRRMN
jgi:beta-aspartyl-dipeptidase (metallo-type)